MAEKGRNSRQDFLEKSFCYREDKGTVQVGDYILSSNQADLFQVTLGRGVSFHSIVVTVSLQELGEDFVRYFRERLKITECKKTLFVPQFDREGSRDQQLSKIRTYLFFDIADGSNIIGGIKKGSVQTKTSLLNYVTAVLPNGNYKYTDHFKNALSNFTNTYDLQALTISAGDNLIAIEINFNEIINLALNVNESSQLNWSVLNCVPTDMVKWNNRMQRNGKTQIYEGDYTLYIQKYIQSNKPFFTRSESGEGYNWSDIMNKFR